jgi:hypothetical protein
MNFALLGGWCGPKMALKDLGFDNNNLPSLPFDSVRSTIEGVIDCIETDFENFFPKELKKDERFPAWTGFLGEYVGFYHHDLLKDGVIESFKRKINRFDEQIKKDKCVFIRSIVRDNCEDELRHCKRLESAIEKKYPGISYIVCFLIMNQNNSQYYKNLSKNTFLFTVNDLSYNEGNLKHEFKPVIDFIANNNLFENIPEPNDIRIIGPNERRPRLWLIDNRYPMVHYDENNK